MRIVCRLLDEQHLYFLETEQSRCNLLISKPPKRRDYQHFHRSSYLSLTSCAAVMTEEMLLVSICSRATWAMGCEARRAERAACARCMFLQARHSWSPAASCERRRSHSARPMPLQGNMEGWNVLKHETSGLIKSHFKRKKTWAQWNTDDQPGKGGGKGETKDRRRKH